MKTLLYSLLVMVAACGGSKSAPPAEPAPMEAPAEPTPTEAAVTTPAEPAPAEPGQPDPAKAKADLLAAEMTAYAAAKPVFENFCKGCHMSGNRNASAKKLAELDITKYPFTGKHANTKDIRSVLGIGGGKVTMPKGGVGSVKGDDLALIAAWADAADAAHAGGAHE